MTYEYDYFVKDHLGNVRMVLTNERQTDIYQAGMEPANRSFETALFGDKINTTENAKPMGFDTDGNNTKVSMLNGNMAERRMGPGVILKVMSGDKIKASSFAWYLPNGDNTTDNTLPSIISNILSQLTPGISGAGKGTTAQQVTNDLLQPGMQSLLDGQQPVGGRPKAYLNWILLDEEQFKKVDGSSGFVQVPLISDPGTEKQLLQAASGGEIEVLKNGYFYIYVSNVRKALMFILMI